MESAEPGKLPQFPLTRLDHHSVSFALLHWRSTADYVHDRQHGLTLESWGAQFTSQQLFSEVLVEILLQMRFTSRTCIIWRILMPMLSDESEYSRMHAAPPELATLNLTSALSL